MKLSNNSIKLLIESIALLVFGILFCCAKTDVISIMIGIILIASGALVIIASLLMEKRLLNVDGFSGAAVVALGIFFLVFDFAGDLVNIILGYVPYLMTLIGIIIILDAILTLIPKNRQIVVFIAELIIGAISLTLGICALTIPELKENALIILGIILIVFAVYLAVAAFILPKGNNKKEDVIDAE